MDHYYKTLEKGTGNSAVSACEQQQIMKHTANMCQSTKYEARLQSFPTLKAVQSTA